ncbi:integrase core domain protein [Rhizoctonia solani]|uniref:Integrase core domain protein n=1 Tax=Rhizoctonia solani TaxID=456999 RepID=A0A8H8P5G4_9AGAM|nr:integrase core domain protein [Rhizoctonia solani]QRW23942.1 integrase core domain protein [Rhizoctonia solani]
MDNKSTLTNEINNLRSRILAEAHRKSIRNTDGKAFFSSNKPLFNQSVRTNSSQHGPDKSKSKCNNCGKIGHWAAECRGPGGGAYKHGQQNRGNQPNRRFNSLNKPQNNNACTHIAVAENSKTNDYAFSTFKNLRKDFSKSTCTWIADSGTTTHIANDQRLFTDYRKSLDYVTGVAGKEPILGQGTVELWCLIDPEKTKQRKIMLTNVAHVPSSPANLISLSLITDKGYCVSMDQDQLVIYGPNNKLITFGLKLQNRSQGNLWKLNAKTINKVSVNNKHTPTELALVKQTSQTWLDWHKVLGHIGLQALQQIKNTNAVNGMEIVEDNIGLNFKCFLQHKDETLNEYKSFEALLNTQKDKKIKRVRFNNGREFVNNDWIEHAAQRGTVLETTALYSAQQNGIAKQLNQTLTDKAQAMLLESAAPKFLWNEALAYACYLKNQVPTQVHGTFWKTPFEAFWGRKPNVSVLRPWGTKCYVLDQGISDVQGKSWRYYKTRANWILHSRNILFPKDHAAIKDVADNTDWGELVAPPAEGEMTQTNSAAEQPTKPTGTGGAHVVSKNKENDSKLPSDKKPIKSELKTEGTTSNSHTQPIQQPVVPKSNTSCSKPAMRTNPSAVTTQSIQAINALTPGSGDGIRTRSRNPNAPAISLARERGGVKISINDTTPSELKDIFAGSSDTDSSKSNDHRTFSLLTDTSSVLSAPTIPSELAFALDALPTLQSTTSIDGTLADKFGRLQLSDYTPTKPDSPLATTGHLEQSWAALANLSNPNNHPTVEEALAGPQANKWLEAMRKEVSTLERMGTYKHVEPPKDCKPIGNKWVLTLKRNANGEPERYKARLVAQGFSQQPGINFDKTFAPVLDVNAAYLHAEVDKELYMQQIPYFKDGTNRVLKLKRSIYGLKQAGRMWNKLYNTKLQSISYRPCLTDLCVYYRLEDYKVPPTSTITSRTPTRSSLRASSHTGRSYPAPTMATRSRTSSRAQSPFDPRDLGPQLPSATPIELGEVSLERVTRLLLGLLSQVKNLEQKLKEVKETGIETQTNVENISQTVDVVKDGLRSLQLHGPRTPEEAKPPVVEATPRPLHKTKPVGSVSGPSFWPEQPKGLPSFAQPAPQRAIPPRVPSPLPSLRLRSPIGAPAPPPPAPVAAYPAPVKVDHPDAYTGKIGSEAKQWLTRMLAWTRLNARMFPTDQEVLSFLLMNMKDAAGAWAHPHLDQLGSHRAIIQTVEGFKLEFLAAFGDPDATRAAERKITTLTQSGTCADYITKFRTLAMELDWNDAALQGQFARGLHWEVSRQIATREHQPRTLLELQNAALVIDNALCKERASHPPRDNKSSKPSNPARGTSTGQSTTGSKKLSDDPNFVSEEERNRRRAAGACIKCGKMGHKFADCRTGWKATPIKEKGKAKETAKIGEDSEYQSGKE